MKIDIKQAWGDNCPVSVEEYASTSMDGDSYDSGQIETLGRGLNLAQEMLGRMVGTLAEKGLLTAPEVVNICKGYGGDGAVFVSESKGANDE